jgi:hypothetical protein
MDEEASAAVAHVGLPRLQQHVAAVAVVGKPDASVDALDRSALEVGQGTGLMPLE